MEDNSFPLNLEFIAEQQAEDQHLQTQLLCEQPKYMQSVKNNVTIYTHPATQAVYVSSGCRQQSERTFTGPVWMPLSSL
jgi:hypothetical protein